MSDFFKEIRYVLGYKLRQVPTWLFLGFIVILVVVQGFIDYQKLLKTYADAATFFVTFALLLDSFRKQWVEQLPLRLTVIFREGNKIVNEGAEIVMIDDKIVMRAENVYLAHVSDIRNWAQQVGRQMASPKVPDGKPVILEFGLVPRQKGPTIKYDNNAKAYRVYTFTVDLTSIPVAIEKEFAKNRYKLVKYNLNGTLEFDDFYPPEPIPQS